MATYRPPEPQGPYVNFRNWLTDAQLPVPTAISVPKAGYLEWATALTVPGLSAMRSGSEAKGCLVRFCGLATATDEQIAAFAQDFGVLGFCEHGKPGCHAGCSPKLTLRRRGKAFEGLVYYQERTDDWRKLAQAFEGLQAMAARIDSRQAPRRADWSSALPDTSPDLRDFMWLNATAGELVAVGVTWYLEDAALHPALMWDDQARQFNWTLMNRSGRALGEGFGWPPHSLYRVLVSQLAMAATSGQLVRCANCKRAFDFGQAGYEREPRRDRGAYCGDWCKKESHRQQKQEYKRRKRKEIDSGKATKGD